MSDEISEAELDAMEARANAAIAGPWESFVEGRDHTSGDDFIRTGGLDNSSPDLYVSLSYGTTTRRSLRLPPTSTSSRRPAKTYLASSQRFGAFAG